MTRTGAVPLAAAAATVAGTQLFVAPQPTAARSQRVRASETQAPATSSLPALAVAGIALAAVSRAQTKTARQFFGGSSSSYKSFEPSAQAGVQDPVGFWDPLDFQAAKDETEFKRLRALEIKHGRIAMYATMGYIVPRSESSV